MVNKNTNVLYSVPATPAILLMFVYVFLIFFSHSFV